MTPEERVLALRREFDRSFSEPPRTLRNPGEAFLLIRVGGEPYALRLEEIAALGVRRPVVPLAGARPDLLGLVGHRGTLVALFSLSRLLGYPSLGTVPRWFAVLKAGAGIGLGFDAYEGCVKGAPGDLVSAGDPAGRSLLGTALRHQGKLRPLVDTAAIEHALNGSTPTLSKEISK